MFCANCGNEIPEGQACACQPPQQPQQPQPQYQQPQQPQPQYQQPQQPQPQYQQPQQPQPQYQQQPQQPMVKTDNSKTYSILSYIGILWIVGMVAMPEKLNPRVRFHVGQGIILSIVSVGLSIITTILNIVLGAVMTTTKTTWYGVTYPTTSAAYGIISTILWLAVSAVTLTLLVIGVLNVVNNRDKELPIVGKFAFYK